MVILVVFKKPPFYTSHDTAMKHSNNEYGGVEDELTDDKGSEDGDSNGDDDDDDMDN